MKAKLLQKVARQGVRKGTAVFFLLLFALCASCSERRQGLLIEEADERVGQSAYGEAAEILKRAVFLNPESRTAVRALYKLGFVLETYLKDFESALLAYNEFLRLSHDPVSAYEVRKRVANLYFEQTGDPDKAADMYRKLLSLSPDTLEGDLFQFRIGQAYFRANEFEKAREGYQRLIERYPKSHFVAHTRYEIGNSYYMESKYEIALEALRQVLRHHPQSEFAVEAQFLTAQCLEHLERLPQALQAFESIRERYMPAQVIDMRIRQIGKRLKKAK